MLEWIAAGLVLTGGIFAFIAALGLVNMPDVYIRMHASTKAGTLGVGLICSAFMVLAGTWTGVIEGGIIIIFMLVTAPIGAHLIGRAAFHAGVPFDRRTSFEDGCENYGAPRHATESKE
ncbi:monovalent cation/H(+) antiporter subunit G [Pontivivens insulae]|uniref:Na(+)/H(+) antiporter subunit G n=1 Tax=Pontivivens insulae TaxID=1639689 RepID=A0A2R8A660_9RHOB|nr:monovalent cation/H(+) antiporter subunit G [Pontivivens insulae]RED17834.1 multisubunit sodium/proton antiporter MrpG subunit [Pontivivens insulae]SPF27724.1 Na(+)/H(+) antiporter subunit G [Pontivivens insulae]